MTVFRRVLVANRGEIAVRIMRTLRALGIESVAVHSRRDAGSLHVAAADIAVPLPDTDATGGYLDVAAVLSAAADVGCDALHPGYGFLSENPRLADACAAAGITFIGPSSASMQALGDKDAARRVAAGADVPVVPGTSDLTAARQLALPLLIKPVAGGGGKGMHVVYELAQLQPLAERAQREASAAFGDGRLIVERYLPRARHIEVQVAGFADGRVIAIGDRECTLQRRHQKVVEEAPAPGLPSHVREQLHAQAVAVVAAVGYLNLATVEFVMSCEDPAEFYFLEVNTRLQVEHPVTEAVTGLDLVELQLRIAYAAAVAGGADAATAGTAPAAARDGQDNGVTVAAVSASEALAAGGPSPDVRGHAVEARVYAEDPAHGFLPTGGRLLTWQTPVGDGVRVDSGVRAGDVIGSGYDPMIAKVIASGDDREHALSRLDSALAATSALGVTTNTGFLRGLLAREEVLAGRMDTRLIDRIAEEVAAEVPVPDEVVVAWALGAASDSAIEGDDAWAGNWRVAGFAPMRVRGTVLEQPLLATVSRVDGGYRVTTNAGSHIVTDVSSDNGGISFTTAGSRWAFTRARSRTPDGDGTWLGHAGQSWCIEDRVRLRAATGAGTTSPEVRSPMPGTVLQVLVSEGDAVASGQALVVLEAMKMEHQVTAPHNGVVAQIVCTAGGHVRLRELLAVVEAST